ncbi:MAG: hypothetical protein J2P38_09095, partial [Candidatus Dormibacteraeota bacterium]|nr:hypothetical protein [Candidatus Dormibacteraeota bacterium]
MSQQRPWDRLRSALHRESPETTAGPRPLAGVTVDGFRSWARGEGLTEQEPEDGLVSAEGAHRLGAVRAYCLVDGTAGPVTGVDLAVTAAHPGAP